MKAFKFLMPLFSAFCLFGCGSEEAAPVQGEEDSGKLLEAHYTIAPVKTACIYAAIAEKPDMRKVLLIGEEAKSAASVFSNAGVKSEESIRGKYDCVFVSCEGMSKDSCARMMSHLTENGIAAWMMDMSKVKMSEFKEMLDSFDCPSTHLWMCGDNTWVLVGRKSPKRIKLSSIMEAMTRENSMEDLAKARICGIGELFASYVGEKEDLLPAFKDLKDDPPVKCEYFVPREKASTAWIYCDIEPEMFKLVEEKIAALQENRRRVILGLMRADKGEEDEALDILAEATLVNPNDPLILERLERIERNAIGYHNAEQLLLELKCYETMLIIQPNNLRAVTRMGELYDAIGRHDIAEKCFERAKVLSAE